jgi:hypothetical protein
MAFRVPSRQEADGDALEIYLYFSWRPQTSETSLENLCPSTDIGFIKVLLTFQTSKHSESELSLEDSISIRVTFPVIYRL